MTAAPHSVKFLNFVISSNSSCKSTSLILFVKLGISVLASSALPQHKLPAQTINQHTVQISTAANLDMVVKHTQL